jgi:carboxyl-terminal processing protease
MPRRNLFVLLIVSVVAVACHLKVDRNARILAYAIDQIEQRSLHEIDEQALFEGAMEGMIRRLDDDYSAYINPEKAKEFEQSLNKQFGGVGIVVALPEESRQLTVINPLLDSPAYEAGVRAGDKILQIDGQSTKGLSLQDCVGRMQGDPGDPVVLTILHQDEDEPVRIKIVRAIISVDTVLGDTRAADGSWNFFLEGHDSQEGHGALEERERIGYLRINSFAGKTADELRRAVRWLVEHKMRGLILDLRNNPGGFLDQAVEICDLFVDSGIIVTTRRRGGRVYQTFQARQEGTYRDFPIAVLVNGYSASASEIVAACLQDHHRAVVVGQRTYGKGTVQELIYLEDGQGVLKLTTSSYWRPSEKDIDRRKGAGEDEDWGVRPDDGYEVIVQSDEFTKLVVERLRRDVYKPAEAEDEGSQQKNDKVEPPVDRQLQKAVEYIEGAL